MKNLQYRVMVIGILLSLVCVFQFCIAPSMASTGAVKVLEEKEIDLLFFAPDKGEVIKELLLEMIAQSKGPIKAALYRLTDKDVAQALINAHKRGIPVEMIVDSGAANNTFYSAVLLLVAAGIPVYIYQTTDLFVKRHSKAKPKYQSIMHHKTFIFSDTVGGSVVMFGSLNTTTAGFYGNEEVVSMRNNKNIVQGFEEHFAKLKKRSHLCDAVNLRKKVADKRAVALDAKGFGRSSLLQSLLS